MIPIDVIESTANELMAKAAIEIPDDYLTGLKKAADSEDGDLSSYVLRAMLDNYVAAKEDDGATGRGGEEPTNDGLGGLGSFLDASVSTSELADQRIEDYPVWWTRPSPAARTAT